MGKAFKRLLAERRKLHKELPAIVEIKEQVVETVVIAPPKVKPKKEEAPVVVQEVENNDDDDSTEATEELFKNTLDALNKKATTKKK